MQYRRDYNHGASYFFTIVTYRRQPLFAYPQAIINLRQAFQQEIKRRPFVIDAIVIMPDHIHAIWTMPTEDADYSMRWRNIKREFTKNIPESQRPKTNSSRQHKSEQAIWQRRFWEHRIRNEQDFAQHVNYVHYNPVKHGYVNRPVDWPHSSIHRYIRQGVLPINWGEIPISLDDTIGKE